MESPHHDIKTNICVHVHASSRFYSQGHIWGLRGPCAGCASGPCLKLFNLYVRSIYIFLLFTQCLRFLKFGVRIIQCKIALHRLQCKN